MPSTNAFNEICGKINLLRSITKNLTGYVMHQAGAYYSTSYSRGI